MTHKSIVKTQAAPQAIGPYSQAIVANGLVFCSGSIPLDPVSGNVIEGGIEAQTKRVLDNMKAVLEGAGSSLDKVVKTTVFLQSMGDFAAMNGIYATYFVANPPARSTVEVAKLPRSVLVEIECIALA
ncbi:MAG: RidA family protein [Thermoflexales bacterium]|nr:RidA family protein [Thermoflexales bacterium]